MLSMNTNSNDDSHIEKLIECLKKYQNNGKKTINSFSFGSTMMICLSELLSPVSDHPAIIIAACTCI